MAQGCRGVVFSPQHLLGFFSLKISRQGAAIAWGGSNGSLRIIEFHGILRILWRSFGLLRGRQE